jgi:hypothetical protein
MRKAKSMGKGRGPNIRPVIRRLFNYQTIRLGQPYMLLQFYGQCTMQVEP